MKIQGKDFPDGELKIRPDYERSEHAGAAGCFQIADVILVYSERKSILTELNIDQGKHYYNLDEVAEDLGIDSNKLSFEE